jgi:hypothetical protein
LICGGRLSDLQQLFVAGTPIPLLYPGFEVCSGNGVGVVLSALQIPGCSLHVVDAQHQDRQAHLHIAPGEA